jgi:predicted RNA-binding protein YlqC (UPF0109 family)
MSEIDQQFIEFVVKSLVGKPDAVEVKRTIDEKGVLLELTVDPEDLGRVIGKRGATAQSLRTLLRALGTKNDARYNLKIIDNGVGGPRSDDKREDKPADKEPKEQDTAPPEQVEDVETEAPAEEPVEDKAEEETKDNEEQASDRLRQTREELADLDDLDV